MEKEIEQWRQINYGDKNETREIKNTNNSDQCNLKINYFKEVYASHFKAQQILRLIEDSRVHKLKQRPNSVCIIFVNIKYIMQLLRIRFI